MEFDIHNPFLPPPPPLSQPIDEASGCGHNDTNYKLTSKLKPYYHIPNLICKVLSIVKENLLIIISTSVCMTLLHDRKGLTNISQVKKSTIHIELHNTVLSYMD